MEKLFGQRHHRPVYNSKNKRSNNKKRRSNDSSRSRSSKTNRSHSYKNRRSRRNSSSNTALGVFGDRTRTRCRRP